MQLVPALESGGVERGTLEVAGELVRRGHRSLVVSAGGRLVEPLVAGGSTHIACPIGRKSPLTLRCVPTLRRLLTEQRVDILHARSRVPAWVAWLAWKSLPAGRRPRLVTTVHGRYSVNAYSRIMTRGEAVIAVSNSIRDYILANYLDVPEARIRVIHRGIDPSEFPHGFRPTREWLDGWEAQFPHLAGRKLLTLAGRITRLKGHFEFLELLAALKAEGVGVHGLIVGAEDPRRRRYAAAVRQRVCDLDLSGDVTFTGHRSDIREIYAISSAVLSLSTQPESFGRTALEPLALGVPVIGYDHGGVGEILRAVAPQGAIPLLDAQALKQQVTATLSEPHTLVPPFEQFRLQVMLDQTLALYGELAGGTAARQWREAA
jgi:glycosyltransferase involved in cell wall biosynthesis